MNVKTSLRNGNTSIGAWLTFSSPEVAECMAASGTFEWLVTDMEHGATGPETAVAVFHAVERRGVAPFARLPSADPFLARRLLDQGCRGLIVPAVESATAFTDFARHCLYPPEGRRGVGLSRCNDWGASFQENLTFRPVLVPQIETRAGVAASAELAALPFVDALFLGPFDLSAALGQPGNFATESFKAAVNQVNQACAAASKAKGIHQVKPSRTELDQRIAEGFRFIAFGTDAEALRTTYAKAP